MHDAKTHIKIKCSCGSEFEIECISGNTATLESNRFQQAHKGCIETATLRAPTSPPVGGSTYVSVTEDEGE